MDQQELIHEDWRDALRHVVKALGGHDAVGVELWPAKTRHAAGAWLSDCLNPERPAKLDLEELLQILRMGHAKGVHLGLHYLCDELGYCRPSPVEPHDQEAELLRQWQLLTERQEALAARMDRMRQTEGVRHVARVRGVR